jgi:DNA-binding transcriptional regulator YiaG
LNVRKAAYKAKIGTPITKSSRRKVPLSESVVRLRLSQRKAGELLGGGPRAFQKYESGEVMVSAAMSNLLRLLDKDPRRVKELDVRRAG